MRTPDYDPFALFTSGLAFWADTARTAQSQYLKAFERSSARLPAMMTWKDVSLPVFSPMSKAKQSDTTLEGDLREAFQVAADINLNSWTYIAEMVSALPDWAHWPTEVPGRAMTDMFDQFRRAQPSSTSDR